ncbi:MAG: hypothetical protein R2796_00915 [Chitinophagaceae bacterium]
MLGINLKSFVKFKIKLLKKKRTIFFAQTILLWIFFVGCQRVMMLAYGIKQPKYLDKKEVQQKNEALKNDPYHSFILKRTFFAQIETRDTLHDKKIVKCSPMISKYEQPLQVLYFNDSGELVSFHNNCNAGGFPKLNWNNNHQFDKFIPKTSIPLSDSIISFRLIVSNLDPLYNQHGVPENGIKVVVFWSAFMFKQSKALIKTVKKNLGLDESHLAQIIYVNTDNCFIDETYSKQINK